MTSTSRPLRIVLLGGTGFVGRALAQRLRADGHAVCVLSRNPGKHAERLLAPGAELRRCDVFDAPSLQQAFAGSDAVVNLVGILNETGDDGRGFHKAHVELTRTVVAACHAAGVRRLLQMSALNAGRGSSHYLRSRGEAEAEVRESGLDWTILQSSVMFGRGDGLFSRFAALLDALPVFPLARSGCRFAPVFVGDVVEAFARALATPAAIGQTYELYGPDVFTLAQIVRMTARQRGQRRYVLPLPDLLGRLQGWVFDFVPGKPFSSDNYRSLLSDSVGGVDGLHRLGIEPTPVSAVLPDILGHTLARQPRFDRNRATSH
jgi:NADH dehydrogenase